MLFSQGGCCVLVGGVVELWNLLGRGLLDVSGCGYELVELVYCCGSRGREWQALQRRSPSHVASFVRSRLYFGFLALMPFGLPACWESRELMCWYSCLSV